MSLNHQELTTVVERRISHCGHRNELYSLRKLVQVSLSIPSSPPTGASFDQFQVDLTSGELMRSGVRVPIQGQPFHVLRLLLEAEGKVVTREELRQVLWPEDTFVDETTPGPRRLGRPS